MRPEATPAVTPKAIGPEDAPRYYVEYYDVWGDRLRHGAEYVRLLKPFSIKEGSHSTGYGAAKELAVHFEDKTGEAPSSLQVSCLTGDEEGGGA